MSKKYDYIQYWDEYTERANMAKIEDHEYYDQPVVIYRSKGTPERIYMELKERWLSEDEELYDRLIEATEQLGFTGFDPEEVSVSLDGPGYGYVYNWHITRRR